MSPTAEGQPDSEDGDRQTSGSGYTEQLSVSWGTTRIALGKCVLETSEQFRQDGRSSHDPPAKIVAEVQTAPGHAR